jgi:hypothetical protein
MKRCIWNNCAAIFFSVIAIRASASSAGGQELMFKIPPVKMEVKIENRPISITASGVISKITEEHGQNVFRLELIADLSELQQSITEVLRAQIDRSDRCGERIAIQNANLTPLTPASLVVAKLHFERWTCVKGHDTSRRYRMTHMFAKGDFAAPHLPGASIGPGEQEFLSAVALDKHPVTSRTSALSFANPNVQPARTTHKSHLVFIVLLSR